MAWWKPVLTTLTTAPGKQIQRWYRCGICYHSRSIDWYTPHSNNIANSDISRVMSGWAVFTLSATPLIVAAHTTTSTPRITPRYCIDGFIISYYRSEMYWLYSFYDPFVVYSYYICSRSRPLICTTLQHGICHSISAWWWNITMKRWIFTLS